MTEPMNICPSPQKTFIVNYPGVVPYEAALKEQERLRQLRMDNRIPDTVLLLQHPHVYTTGRFKGEEDILVLPEDIPIFHTNRGGSITYHGPGQLVGYPVLDLKANSLGVREYIWKLEEVSIKLLGGFDIEAQRHSQYPGSVWASGRKICSIGINVSRHVTTHGFALNVNNDLKYFEAIRPCGMPEKMTSMSEFLGRVLPFDAVVSEWINWFSAIFGLKPEVDATLLVEETAIA
jgi:lipoate-protein ligase B